MGNKKREEILKRIASNENLPALSPLAVQLIELAAEDEASASDLSSTIEKDPGLTTRLLKTVSSVVYRTVEPVTSVRQAVVRLGFNRVRIMALSLSLRDTFELDDGEGLDYGLFWKRSVYRALVARDFSQPLDAVDPDEAFVAGLIAEIGLLVLYRVCSESDRADFAGCDRPFQEMMDWQEERLGIHHRDVGSIIMKQWRFPENLVKAQSCFGSQAFVADAPPLCQVVELAHQATEIAYEHTVALHQLQQLVYDKLGIDPEAVNALLVTAFTRVEDLAEQLMIEADARADMVAVMEKANRSLARISQSFDTTIQGIVGDIREYAAQSGGALPPSKDILQNTLDAVAHEIRNPLLAIGGFAKRLAKEGDDESMVRRYAQIITDESDRLEHTLKEILGYCQDYQPLLVEVDLISFIAHILDALKEKFAEKRITIVRQFPDQSLPLRLDRQKIFETMTRLMELATAMAEQGGHSITIAIEHTEETGNAVVTISDDGRSLSKEEQDALVDGKLTEKTLGNVFKLSLVNKIIEAHQGSIHVTAGEGGGNTVSVRLPVL